MQIHSMCRSLSQFTDIFCALVVGGNKNLKAQVCCCASLPRFAFGSFLGTLRAGGVVLVGPLLLWYRPWCEATHTRAQQEKSVKSQGLIPPVARCAC